MTLSGLDTLLALLVSVLTVVSLVLDLLRRRARRKVDHKEQELADARSLGVALAKGYFYNFLAPLLQALALRLPLKDLATDTPIPYAGRPLSLRVLLPERLTFEHQQALEENVRLEHRRALLVRPDELCDLTLSLAPEEDNTPQQVIDVPSTLRGLLEYLLAEVQQQASSAVTRWPRKRRPRQPSGGREKLKNTRASGRSFITL